MEKKARFILRFLKLSRVFSTGIVKDTIRDTIIMSFSFEGYQEKFVRLWGEFVTW